MPVKPSVAIVKASEIESPTTSGEGIHGKVTSREPDEKKQRIDARHVLEWELQTLTVENVRMVSKV